MLLHGGTLQRRSGIAIAKALACLVVLVGIVALNLDGGRAMDERRVAQSAADAAALAGAAELYRHHWTAPASVGVQAARTAAIAAAAENGYPASAVQVNSPPINGAFAGRAGHIEVEILSSIDVSFGRIFTDRPIAVAARAVGRGEPLPIGIILLRASGAAAFRNTAAAFALVNKPLIVNSNDPAALQSSGLTIVGLTNIDVTGQSQITSLLPLLARLRHGVRPTLDPLAFLPVPDVSSMPVRSAAALTINTIVPRILQPGVYRGGIRITGLSVVVMLPGVYVMEGGGFRVDGAATVTGLDTVVYNSTGTAAPGPISIAGLGKVVMTAPLSGTYQGINFFQNRTLTQPVSMTGLGLTTITGTVYAARAPVNLSGSAAIGLDILGGAYVAESMTVSGVGAVTVNLGLNPPRVPDVRLVE